jgi:hypothetical protein
MQVSPGRKSEGHDHNDPLSLAQVRQSSAWAEPARFTAPTLTKRPKPDTALPLTSGAAGEAVRRLVYVADVG